MPKKEQNDQVEAGKFKFPIPKWSVQILGIVVVLALGYTYLSGPFHNFVETYRLGKNTANDQGHAYDLFAKAPMLVASKEGDLGVLEASLYFTEDCISVVWKSKVGSSRPRPHFVCGIIKENQPESPGRVVGQKYDVYEPHSNTSSSYAGFVPPLSPEDQIWPSLRFKSQIETNALPTAAPPRTPQGACLNPHPGNFKSWYGQRNGCWLQVWRQFPDNCTHYQWFNTCGGYWEVNPDGSPRVFWTACYH
jgi:hypothetical protein